MLLDERPKYLLCVQLMYNINSRGFKHHRFPQIRQVEEKRRAEFDPYL